MSIGEFDREEDNAGFSFTAAFTVIDHAMINGAFAAADVGGLAALPGLIDQGIAFFPTDNEAYPRREGLRQPGNTGKPPIPDVDHHTAPTMG